MKLLRNNCKIVAKAKLFVSYRDDEKLGFSQFKNCHSDLNAGEEWK